MSEWRTELRLHARGVRMRIADNCKLREATGKAWLDGRIYSQYPRVDGFALLAELRWHYATMKRWKMEGKL